MGTPPLHRFVRHAGAIVTLISLTSCCYAPSLRFGFLSDDFALVRFANAPLHLVPLFTTAGGDGFYRPVGSLSLAATASWAGCDAPLWHAAALGQHCANVVLLYLVALRFELSLSGALLAAALFAVHGSRPEAAVWIAGRFDLLCGFFTLAALWLALDARPLPSMFAAILVAAAILTKEAAYPLPLVLVLLALSNRCSRLLAASACAIAALLFAHRLWLFHGIGGYASFHVGLATGKAVSLRLWSALYFPINWSDAPDTLLRTLFVVYVAAILYLVYRLRRSCVTPAAIVLLLVIPALPLLAIGPDLRNSRVLYLPSIGFCLLLGQAIAGLPGRSRMFVAVAVLAFHCAVLRHNLAIWESVAERMRLTQLAAAECPSPIIAEPGWLRGVPFLANVQAADLNPAAKLPQRARGGIEQAGRLLALGDSSQNEPRRRLSRQVFQAVNGQVNALV